MMKVKKNILILTAGTVWAGAGLMLIVLATSWFSDIRAVYLILGIIIGGGLGLLKAKLVFNKISEKNIARINAYPSSNVCFFAFIKWQTYLLIALMSVGGATVRKAGLLPKEILIPIYLGVGLALFFSSFRYLLYLRNKRTFADS